MTCGRHVQSQSRYIVSLPMDAGPFRRLNPTPKETPRKSRQTESPSYRSAVLPLAREAIRLDVGSVPEVSYDFFRDTVLPRPTLVSDDNIRKIKTSLIRGGFIVNGRWLAFQTDPAKQEAHEDIVFESLFDVNNRILKAAGLNQIHTKTARAAYLHSDQVATDYTEATT